MELHELFLAIQSDDHTRTRSLLDLAPELIHLRNPDTEKWDELTPLHCAAKYGHLELVTFLVGRGAEVYSNPFNSYPAIAIAKWASRQAIVEYFLNEIPEKTDGTNKLGITIHLAARFGWLEIVQKHIQADPLAAHQRGWLGDTPLHWPAHNGSVEIVQELLDAGADIEADELNCYGGKPLHWAAEHSPATVKLLLENGAKVDARNVLPNTKRLGFTPLIMNASQKEDCSEATELLLRADADAKAVDSRGKTALDHATARGNQRIIALLRRA